MANTTIRRARPSDAESIANIYTPIVEQTAISFELHAPSEEQIAKRIESTLRHHEWLVADTARGLAGYAYASAHRPREAYDRSVETSAYVHSEHRGQGLGRALYEALFVSLASRSFHNAFAGIALPNDASTALHKAVGFEHIGTFKEVGYKFGRFHDVSWWQRRV